MTRSLTQKYPTENNEKKCRRRPQGSAYPLYGIIDLREELSSLCGFGDVATFQQAHRGWIDDSRAREAMAREGVKVRVEKPR
jgi:hypothetical protein